jgi:hypothetical protein
MPAPAFAGAGFGGHPDKKQIWIPACAGMTNVEGEYSQIPGISRITNCEFGINFSGGILLLEVVSKPQIRFKGPAEAGLHV